MAYTHLNLPQAEDFRIQSADGNIWIQKVGKTEGSRNSQIEELHQLLFFATYNWRYQIDEPWKFQQVIYNFSWKT